MWVLNSVLMVEKPNILQVEVEIYSQFVSIVSVELLDHIRMEGGAAGWSIPAPAVRRMPPKCGVRFSGLWRAATSTAHGWAIWGFGTGGRLLSVRMVYPSLARAARSACMEAHVFQQLQYFGP